MKLIFKISTKMYSVVFTVSKQENMALVLYVYLCYELKKKVISSLKKIPIYEKITAEIFFCSTLSEFENFLLCERILINVITCQNETSS
jgi:hypothetical protein